MNRAECPKQCGHCGIDLNRNFGFKWGVSGTSLSPCSEIYGGTRAFSEPESRALRDILHKHKNDIKLYLSIHSFGCIFLYPWGYARQRVKDWKDLEKAAKVAAKRIAKVSKRETAYKVGNTGIEFYPAAGGSDDYAKSIGIKYSYTIEVQGGGPNGFDPSPEDIKDYSFENTEGIIALAVHISDHRSNKRTRRENGKASHCSTYFCLKFYVMVCLCIFVNKCF
ncbi:hypothetical protein ILUMI_16715 [Ignelater luminosus]|uniref:Peptidase M14 domain-containing protein n=1 Tax=Ignelater luminosus TaxID=2038154 RepID=A0A8K0CRS8_IGNLU|nr:hypothetical protein ILUMI_16715 [Ignelater luminosus]